MSKLDVDKHINVEIELDELDLTSAESKATYEQIKECMYAVVARDIPDVLKVCVVKFEIRVTESPKAIEGVILVIRGWTEGFQETKYKLILNMFQKNASVSQATA